MPAIKHTAKTTSGSAQGRKALETNDARAIRERLRQWIVKRYGTNRSAFSRAVGLPKATVTGWFGATNRAPDLAQLIAIARAEGLSLDYLILGEGPELRGGQGAGEMEPHVYNALLQLTKRPTGASRELLRLYLPLPQHSLKYVVRLVSDDFRQWFGKWRDFYGREVDPMDWRFGRTDAKRKALGLPPLPRD